MLAEILDCLDEATPRVLLRFRLDGRTVAMEVVDPKAQRFGLTVLASKNPTGQGLVSVKENPQAWLQALPRAYSGSRTRAVLVEDPAAEPIELEP